MGDSISKDFDVYINGYLFNWKYICKIRSFTGAKKQDMEDCGNFSKRDFDPSLFLIQIGLNELSREDTPKTITFQDQNSGIQ